MHILLVSQHFWPEQFKCNDVARELVARGHRVTVLTGLPNYPGGRIFEGFGFFRRLTEEREGYRIVRSWVVPRGRGGAVRLALNYASFVLTGTLRALWLTRRERFDAVLVHETSPVTVGVPAVVAARRQRVPLYFWVLDLWPESLTAAGGVTSPAVLRFFTRLTCWIYDHSRRILLSSRGFRRSILEKGDYADRLVYFPNWADRALSAKADYALPLLPAGFTVMFAGNIGEAQDFEHIVVAADLLRGEPDLHFVLVGDGRKRPWVEAEVARRGLTATVHLVGRHPLEAMPLFFARADVMLVTLKDELIFNLTAPAKLQAYMSAGRPVAAMANGETRDLVAEARCGLSVAAGDAHGLADTLLRLKRMPAAQREALGENGRRYCREHFDLDGAMDRLCRLFEDDVRSPQS